MRECPTCGKEMPDLATQCGECHCYSASWSCNCGESFINLDPEAKVLKCPKCGNKFDNWILKDSGNRREFDTGAQRDMAEGKGRCDLLPACALLRLSKHYEAGAKKYAERNWEKGIPISVMIDSGIRHLLKYLDGQTDEDHLCAAAWNILGAMWMEEKHPELQDIPSRIIETETHLYADGDVVETMVEKEIK